ncbi:hypothetical protein SPI_05466 [Niveomyces insectorum RCEF 264]|uniref:Uncharacterized protein n=1 Tax=Niveomyces insectorum RCEF 264 TaxID=1081102 RepID=A0A167T8Z5_9HYPO|nr:hypothetical protein SPI_05466 [Niveomyces insectorum RCEF 264]
MASPTKSFFLVAWLAVTALGQTADQFPDCSHSSVAVWSPDASVSSIRAPPSSLSTTHSSGRASAPNTLPSSGVISTVQTGSSTTSQTQPTLSAVVHTLTSNTTLATTRSRASSSTVGVATSSILPVVTADGGKLPVAEWAVLVVTAATIASLCVL